MYRIVSIVSALILLCACGRPDTRTAGVPSDREEDVYMLVYPPPVPKAVTTKPLP